MEADETCHDQTKEIDDNDLLSQWVGKEGPYYLISMAWWQLITAISLADNIQSRCQGLVFLAF